MHEEKRSSEKICIALRFFKGLPSFPGLGPALRFPIDYINVKAKKKERKRWKV